MLDVMKTLEAVPSAQSFCSVAQLHSLIEALRNDSAFRVEVVGRSARGVPIHHLRFGAGPVKAFWVASPHVHEPIGSLSVFTLMTLLQQRNRHLLEAGVEWHVMPCIDPDGSLLNEGWSQKPFTFENYMKNFYLQAFRDQVDGSFPIRHKKMVWDRPSREAGLLKAVLDEVRPDFYQALHNTRTGGAFFYLSRDVGQECYREIYRLLEQHDFPLQRRPIWKEICPPYAEGIVQNYSIRNHYDFLEKTSDSPEKLLPYGQSSWDYLAEISPNTLSFIAEMGYARHPRDESEKKTGHSLRKFKLRMDADAKYLATVLLEEWEKVRQDLDPECALYKAVAGGGASLPDHAKVAEGGMPLSLYPTRDTLFNPEYSKEMTEADMFDACIVSGGFFFLRSSYQFVRLLKASPQTAAVRQAVDRLEAAFSEALAEIDRLVDFGALEVMECDRLAKIQLGSGLIVLNTLL